MGESPLDIFCISWKTHSENLLTTFSDQLFKEELVDATLSCEGKFLKVHKLILSASSPFFQKLFLLHGDIHPIIVLCGIRFNILEQVINFIYKGEIRIRASDLMEIVHTAKLLQIKLLSELSISNNNIFPARRFENDNQQKLVEKESSNDSKHESMTDNLQDLAELESMSDSVKESSIFECMFKEKSSTNSDKVKNNDYAVNFESLSPQIGNALDNKIKKSSKDKTSTNKTIESTLEVLNSCNEDYMSNSNVSVRGLSDNERTIEDFSFENNCVPKQNRDQLSNKIKLEPVDFIDKNRKELSLIKNANNFPKPIISVSSNNGPIKRSVVKNRSILKPKPFHQLESTVSESSLNCSDIKKSPIDKIITNPNPSPVILKLKRIPLRMVESDKIPRPPNAFMMFAHKWRKKLAQIHPAESNKIISVRLGIMWKKMSTLSKEKYYSEARLADEDHKKKYPDYYYNPFEARLKKKLKKNIKQTESVQLPNSPSPLLPSCDDMTLEEMEVPN